MTRRAYWAIWTVGVAILMYVAVGGLFGALDWLGAW